MISQEDLLWLYKMSIEFGLEGEKQWLKEEINSKFHTSNYSKNLSKDHRELILKSSLNPLSKSEPGSNSSAA